MTEEAQQNSSGLRNRIEDALLLLQHGRYEGALLCALVAAAGTSRRRYPQTREPDSGKALRQFLIDERLVLTSGTILNFNLQHPGANESRHPGKMISWQQLLCDYLRCELIHEGQLSRSVVIVDAESVTIEIAESTLRISYHFIYGIIRAVETSPENHADWPEVSALPPDRLQEILFGAVRSEHVGSYMSARHRRAAVGIAEGGGPC